MNRKNYQKALRYATSLIRDYNAIYNPFDLVHDAYLKCQDEDFLIRNVKLVWYEKLREKYTSVGDYPQKDISGQKVPKIFVPISPTGSEYGDGTIDIQSFDNHEIKFPLPDSKINVKKHNSYLMYSSKEKTILQDNFDEMVLELKTEGYTNKEIEKILDRSNPIITASVKRIKDKLMHTNSPFNGSKLKIVKRIKRKDFE